MKGMLLLPKMPRRMMMPQAIDKHGQMIRHTPNYNLHVMTHHGKVLFGRKGRKV